MEPYKTLRCAKGEIPEGLCRDHRLKTGIRGKLTVTEGTLVFVDAAGQRRTVAEGQSVAIAPEAVHHLEEVEGAAIELMFFRQGP